MNQLQNHKNLVDAVVDIFLIEIKNKTKNKKMINKKFLNVLMLLALFLSIVLSSCRKDDDDLDPVVTDYYGELTTHLSSNSLDLPAMITSWTISANDLDSIGIVNYFIIDLRSAGVFDTVGHIDGAHNCALADVLDTAANANGMPIVLACYTGQSASWANVALRLSGYTDSKVLLFGMSSWNSVFDSWTANTGDIGIGNSNWVTTAEPTPVTFAAPSLSCTATTGAGILAERVDYILTLGFQGVSGSDVLTTPTNYFINNYWSTTDYAGYGHIDGAYRIKETLNLTDNGFLNLNSAGTVVTYCYTGQTSAAITAYLTILGYNSKSLKFGANGMIYTNMTAHKWSASGSYPYVTTP